MKNKTLLFAGALLVSGLTIASAANPAAAKNSTAKQAPLKTLKKETQQQLIPLRAAARLAEKESDKLLLAYQAVRILALRAGPAKYKLSAGSDELVEKVREEPAVAAARKAFQAASKRYLLASRAVAQKEDVIDAINKTDAAEDTADDALLVLNRAFREAVARIAKEAGKPAASDEEIEERLIKARAVPAVKQAQAAWREKIEDYLDLQRLIYPTSVKRPQKPAPNTEVSPAKESK